MMPLNRKQRRYALRLARRTYSEGKLSGKAQKLRAARRAYEYREELRQLAERGIEI